ncbi:uncharacterized protein LOC17893494, partial [Capsella rubella]|uniref:uncharacterized protein LOC17893494 n=1 Tax=Capsella rubella TaxID=81985 RepID=UPI000CD50241
RGPPPTPKSTPAERLKALNFPIAKITIGQWAYRAINPDDIVAKIYFAKKKLLWEFLDPGKPETCTPRLKSKIEIHWDDVSSFQESINIRDDTGILKIELKKRPTFFIETDPQAGKHTQWKQIEDFTLGHQASTFRRHTLHFHAGVLQKNLEKLLADSFWSKLHQVRFPVQQGIHFDIDYGSNCATTINSSRYILSQTPLPNVSSGLVHHHPQGIGRVGVGEGNFNVAPQLWANSYRQANSWNNTGNVLFGTQAIPPLPQLVNVNESYRQSHFTSSGNLMIQDESGAMQNTRGILGNQAYALPQQTQTNLMMPQHMNVSPMYPLVGPYLANTLLQEEERQRMEHTRLGGNFQIKDYQETSSNDWSFLPYMDMKDDSNDKDS